MAVPRTTRSIAVWDVPVRMFHWLLVAAMTLAAVTGFLLGASWLAFHLMAGLAAAALVLFRLIWGFTGSTFSRFSSFAPSPGAALAHLEDLSERDVPPHAGHNPLGALMVYVLLAMVLGLGASGLLVLGGMLKQGPFKALISFGLGRILREFHELAAWAILALVAAHVAGVVFESWRSRDNLARAMVTGKKHLPDASLAHVTVAPARPTSAWAASLIMAAALLFPAWLGMNSAAQGVPPATLDPAYASNCGDCHGAFHPSLLTAEKWYAIMAGLDDHFGEDASLPPDVTAELTTYLDANAAEHWDTLPAHVFAANSSNEPLRLTTSRFWTFRHNGIADAVFAKPSIKAKSNCQACHADAATGLFAPQAIHIPQETAQ